MKRDMELVREILLSLEESPRNTTIEGYSKEEVNYHVALLIEAGLIDGFVSKNVLSGSVAPSSVVVNRLTWNGHEFAENIRQSEIWNTIKVEFKEASVATIFSVGKQLAEGYAKKKVEALITKIP